MLSPTDPHRQDIRKVSLIREVPLILDACRRSTGMGFTAVARVTEDRWITCASLDHLNFGLLPGDELEVGSTICNEVRTCRDTIAIPDVDTSEIYRNHDTPKRYGFKSYISVPITLADGSFWGTLCAIDPEPRVIDPETLTSFELFAQLVALLMDRQEELEAKNATLETERDTGHMREEFIAIVGHDLRNPIAAVSAGLRMMAREGDLSERSETLVTEMQRALNRANQIIDNLMDFARGRLGSGIDAVASRPMDLEPVIRDVVSEISQVTAHPIECAIDLPHPVRADPQRIGQLLSNLLGNAVTHGASDAPIQIRAIISDGTFQLSVTNEGEQISDAIRASLFQPFARGSDDRQLKGLGLGLYIAAAIARAHSGQIDVDSRPSGQTTFTFKMPV